MDSKELYATAELANIELKPAELAHLQASVEQMVVFFQKMAEVDTSGLEPTTHAFIKGNRVRPDRVRSDSIADNILEQAPDLEDRFICIPNVL